MHAGESGRISRQGGRLMFFFKLRREPGVYSQVPVVMAIQTSVSSAKSGFLSSYEGHLRNLLQAWQSKTDASRGEAADRVSLSSCHSDIVIPINFQE